MKPAIGISVKRPDWIIARHIWTDLAFASQYACGILLDVGCGKKQHSKLFNRRVERYIGFDVPTSVSTNMHSIDFYASVLDIPCRTGSVDTVLCTQVIEHIPEPQRAFAEISRVLKPGGYLILTAPRIWFIHEAPHDYFRFTDYGLKYLAESNGLEVILIKPEGRFWEMIGQQIISYLSYSWGLRPRTLRARIILVLSIIISQVSVFLGRILKDKLTTINYLLVARRPLATL